MNDSFFYDEPTVENYEKAVVIYDEPLTLHKALDNVTNSETDTKEEQ